MEKRKNPLWIEKFEKNKDGSFLVVIVEMGISYPFVFPKYYVGEDGKINFNLFVGWGQAALFRWNDLKRLSGGWTAPLILGDLAGQINKLLAES